VIPKQLHWTWLAATLAALAIAGGARAATVAAVADGAAVLSGPEVLAGIVARALRGECVVGRRFISLLELVDATTVVELHEQLAELRASGHLDAAGLQRLADAGDPAAEFHAGFATALGLGSPADRAGSIEWLRRSASHGHGAGMLALGMSLAGPGIVEDEARFVFAVEVAPRMTGEETRRCLKLLKAPREDPT
jgi:TPR repeat protein